MPIIQNWLDRQGLQLLESLTQTEQEACNTEEGLFEKLSNKFTPQYNETIKSLKFHKLRKPANKKYRRMEWQN